MIFDKKEIRKKKRFQNIEKMNKKKKNKRKATKEREQK